MVRQVAVIVGLVLVVQAAPVAARVRPVVEGGVNASTLDYDQPLGYGRDGWRLSFTVGASVEVPLSERIRLAPGLRYVQKGNRRSDRFVYPIQYQIVQNYLALPVALRMTPFRSRSIALSIGPEVGFLVSAHSAHRAGPFIGSSDDIRDDLENIDVALDVGAEYAFPIENHEGLVRFRYSHGLTDVAKEGHWVTGFSTRGLEWTLGLRW